MTTQRIVYIVDDHADLRFIFQRLFALALPNIPVRVFEHGQALLDALDQLEPLPAFILMDRHMPVLDGYQALHRLKQHPTYQAIPVVMMSAEATSADIKDLLEAGANSFVPKPLDFGAQLELVTQLGKYWLEANQAH